MLRFPNIDPILLNIGPIKIYWYGLMYVGGLAATYISCLSQKNLKTPPWSNENIADLLTYLAVGIILGGRLGYLLFYEPALLIHEPFAIIKFWEPGRSFHGGLIGAFLSLSLYAYLNKRSFLACADFIIPSVPIGLGLGRIGNFINGELWGRVTDVPWGFVFPGAGPLTRHPSQLYESLLEGLGLYIILKIFTLKKRPLGAATGLFLLCYGLIRIAIEVFREPDSHLGFIAFQWLSMGQLLSIPMVIVGYFMIRRGRHAAIS